MTVAERRPIVAGNWKMNTTVDDAVALAASVRDRLPRLAAVETVVCPPFVSLRAVAGELAGTPVAVGAQNMHPEAGGAYTGEVAPPMLVSLCAYVILGHSERRALFGEMSEFVNRKVHAALEHGLRPIVCVGETLEQRDAGRTGEVLREQTRTSLASVALFDGVAIAYEPVWAIGTGRAATPADASDGIAAIRDTVASIANAGVAERIRILYGGSVSAANAADLFAQPQVDGGLVGGASLQAEQFVQIAIAAQDSLPAASTAKD